MPSNVLAVRQAATIETVLADLRARRDRRERPMVYYGARTCWWTHDPRQLYRGPHDLPTDSRGGVLLQTDDFEGFLRQCQESPGHYGRHGFAAFMAAHNANSYLSLTERPWCETSWEAYNEAIDRAVAEGKWTNDDMPPGAGRHIVLEDRDGR